MLSSDFHVSACSAFCARPPVTGSKQMPPLQSEMAQCFQPYGGRSLFAMVEYITQSLHLKASPVREHTSGTEACSLLARLAACSGLDVAA